MPILNIRYEHSSLASRGEPGDRRTQIPALCRYPLFQRLCSHCHLSVESTFVVCIQETGLTALLIAVNKNDRATVEALLAGGANANRTSVWSWCLQSLGYHCVFRMPALLSVVLAFSRCGSPVSLVSGNGHVKFTS